MTVTNPSAYANSLTITNPETGATITVNTNEDAAESAKQAAALRAFINGQLTEATSEAYLRGAGAGAATTGELD
jgi:glycine cleavage system H lipoate-binding protein